MPLTVRRHPRARRIVLRLATSGGGAVATIPAGASFEDGVALAVAHAGWILGRLAAVPARVPFAAGAVLPFLGHDHRLRHHARSVPAVRREEGEIIVAGRAEDLPRRVGDWLRRQARSEIGPRVDDKAAALGRTPGRITVRDPRSRWGSCSAAGNLSFSWRLVMAPALVLDYVVAHEVAHLAHRDHGPRFWHTVAGLTEDMDEGRAWLSRHGRGLHRYG
ncbi:MAG: M48 family metallopeptidase [Rhodospirillales bacterium]